eukprot:g42739.t1
MFDEDWAVDGVYRDFTKAFDKGPHGRLVQKIKSHGIHDELHSLQHGSTGELMQLHFRPLTRNRSINNPRSYSVLTNYIPVDRAEDVDIKLQFEGEHIPTDKEQINFLDTREPLFSVAELLATSGEFHNLPPRRPSAKFATAIIYAAFAAL